MRRFLIIFKGYQQGDLFTVSKTANPEALPTALDFNQLLQVLYRCEDTDNSIVGNSYYIAGGYLESSDKLQNSQYVIQLTAVAAMAYSIVVQERSKGGGEGPTRSITPLAPSPYCGGRFPLHPFTSFFTSLLDTQVVTFY